MASQKELILKFFKDRDKGMMPASYVQKFCLPDVPIGSIRSAMSALAKERKLVKLNRKKTGEFGTKETLWKYNALL